MYCLLFLTYLPMDCPLCQHRTHDYLTPKNDPRHYYRCHRCYLIYTDPQCYLAPTDEKERYLQHQNGVQHPGYVAFLERIIIPALPYLTNTMQGLDYGCGHTPTLSVLLARQGITCYNYDPVFGIDHPFSTYDFIFATECLEHFWHPSVEWQRITGLLKPGGMLGIMTEQWTSLPAFDRWYYKRDPTHVGFYHANTFDYISQHYGYSIHYREQNRCVILKKR